MFRLRAVAVEVVVMVVFDEAEAVECACCGVIVRVKHYRRLGHADEVPGGNVGAVGEGVGLEGFALD